MCEVYKRVSEDLSKFGYSPSNYGSCYCSGNHSAKEFFRRFEAHTVLIPKKNLYSSTADGFSIGDILFINSLNERDCYVVVQNLTRKIRLGIPITSPFDIFSEDVFLFLK